MFDLIAQEIVSIKLITGEEIVTKVVDIRENELIVSYPLITVMTEDPNNPAKTRVMFAPWMVSIDGERVHITKDKIIYVGDSSEEAANSYKTATGI